MIGTEKAAAWDDGSGRRSMGSHAQTAPAYITRENQDETKRRRKVPGVTLPMPRGQARFRPQSGTVSVGCGDSFSKTTLTTQAVQRICPQ